MRSLLVTLLIFAAGCVGPGGILTPTKDNRALATACLVLASLEDNPSPLPGPGPKPGICVNCNGTGILGDGTIKIKCPVCDGKGTVTTDSALTNAVNSRSPLPGQPEATPVPEPPATPVPAERKRYPLRNSWWSGCGSWRHLASGQHAGKFDPVWLSQLTNAELQSLHSDDHEGRVKWASVERGKSETKQKPKTVASGCPGGNCPVSSRPTQMRGGLFSRLRGR